MKGFEKKGRPWGCWTLVDFDYTKTPMLWLLIKLIKCFKDYTKIPKWIFTNEHLEQFSSVQIRIPKCWIRIRQSNPSKLKFKQKWKKQFESLKGGFESHFQRVQTEEGDSNPWKKDSNPDSKKYKLKSLRTMIRIPIERIRIPIPVKVA